MGRLKNEGIPMSTLQESGAVRIARAHVEAWSHHDWETARKSLLQHRLLVDMGMPFPAE